MHVSFLILSTFKKRESWLSPMIPLRALCHAENFHLRQISIGVDKSSLNFKYETLEKATNNFDVSRKIGQGGAGSVYKGTLSNGQTVAVKRLVYNTRQWVDEFFNEVNLVSGIHHKNLVKLLGCSIEGPESLLVYEYVANKSLDHYIFGNNNLIFFFAVIQSRQVCNTCHKVKPTSTFCFVFHCRQE